jgi:superfamily II DNA or RNA helicase
MSYFSANYNRINYPTATETTRGLRNAQLGAVYSIGSYFTINKTEPALIVMPTGSGKTAVLNLSAYLLRANRVLVISSSVMVRGQIAEEFETLKTLKGSNVFHVELKTPKVKEIKSPIKSLEEWENLKEFDVIVGIPNSINEGINAEFRPSKDFFDLILVDEAHHVPAFTWTNVVKAFGEARKIYFTATPFRRDKKEIEGKLAYIYPLSKAYEDKIFGDIGYYPVITDNPNTDLAIALKAEKIFNADKAAGFKHYIMVRTETKENAEVLTKLYQENTSLKLKKVDSTVSYSSIKKTIQKLRDGELDGIICVDMLGEGFDFPNLKIAAIHSPKKSLANTLQFIGRFARTNAENIGEAKFLAIPSDIEIGKRKLYEEGAIWNDIIKNLSEEVIEEEDEIKTVLNTFEKEESDSYCKEDISFYNLNPYCHVKVYKTDGVNLDGTIEISGHEIIYHAISRDHNAIVFITKETERPKWILTDDLINIKHYLFLIYYDNDTNLLFIHSSIKTVQLYDDLVKEFSIGNHNRISKYGINKVLIDISDPEFFNIGMQNRSANSGESYRIITGPNAENTIRKSHGKNYANGHVFMKGTVEGSNVTVGYSSGSKVWSNAYEKIPNFISWCKTLAAKIVSEREVKTNTGFDNLPIGKVVDNFQLPAHSATWHHYTFSEPPFLQMVQEDEILSTVQLLDFAIIVKKELSDLNQLAIDFEYDGLIIPLSYDFTNHFQFRELQEFKYLVEVNGQSIDLLEYLNESPLQIYLDDFATIANHEFFAPPKEGDYQYSADKILSLDWNATTTDITREFYKDAQEKIDNCNKNSIHETLHAKLVAENYDILIYDHGTGEVADFITIKEFGDKIQINLYHVKGSTGNNPGDRVADVYEVCMQAVKSQAWTTNKHTFKNKLLNRTRWHNEKFIIGDKDVFSTLMSRTKRAEFIFSIVQPGISQATFSPKLSHILAATDDSLINSGYEPLIAIGS